MKNIRTPKQPLKLVAIALIVAIIVAVGIFFWSQQNSKNTPSSSDTNAINYDAPSEDEKSAGEQTKLDQTNKTSDDQPVQSNPGRLEISALTQDPTTRDVVVQTKLYDTTWKTCTVTFTKGSSTVTKTANVIYNADFSTCMGFAIKSSEFSSSGNWEVVLSAERSDGQRLSTPPRIISIIR